MSGGLSLAYRARAAVRARQQERLIRSEQLEYETRASREGLSVLEGEDLVAALGERLAGRRSPGWESGLLHTLIATNLDIWEEHNLLPTLGTLGRVTVFDLKERGYRPFTSEWKEDRKRLNSDLVAFARSLASSDPFGLFFACATGYTFFRETIEEIGKLGATTCGYFWDDRLIFRGDWFEGQWTGPASVAASFDLCLTNCSASRIKYFVEGGRALFWPLGANPEVFRPLEKPRDIPVSFIGAAYGARPIWIERLRRQGIDVLTEGPGWPSGPVGLDRMIDVYARSQICLGFSGIGFSRREFCLKGRDIEVPMAGTVYLTPDQPDLRRVFEVGSDVIAFSDEADCGAKVRALLNDPRRCEEIRKQVRRRCLAEHTWKRRFDDLLQVLHAASERVG